MKERYIRQVEKRLRLPRKTKMEVLRDLEEAFASALEHGETEEQVAERLGKPEAFAESIPEQLGSSAAGKTDRKKRAALLFSALLAAAAFSTALFIRASAPPENMIGQADAATTIQIAGGGIDVFWMLIALGCIALITTAYLTVRSIHHKN